MKINNIPIHKAVKKSMLGYLILWGLLGLSSMIQAAISVEQPNDRSASYDYTLQNYPDQVSPIQDEAYLDIEEMPRELTIIMQAAASKDKDHNDVPQLLAMVAEDVQNRQYYKYLFASNGLLPSSEAQQKAHNLNYHLVKAPAGPVIWQVLSFLDQKSYLVIKTLVLPKDKPLCLLCGYMCMHLFGKKLPVQKTGCQAQPFPTTAAPTSAIVCFYSSRFTDQQQRLVISQVGDQAFPDPEKLITSPPLHDYDKLPATAALVSYPSENHQKKACKAVIEVPCPQDQLLIPANGQCLYTTVIMGYLLPVRQAGDKVTARIDHLFGMQPADCINPLHQTLENPTHYLTYLHSDAFGKLVIAFMARMQIKKGTWGGPVEIQTIANKLNVNIQAYYPDPSNPTHLVRSDLTKPTQAVAAITLHIVRDRVHPAEVLTQEQRDSAEANLHYQHYRLKYTLPSSVPDTIASSKKSAMSPYLVEWFEAAETGNSKLLAALYDNDDINVNDKNEEKCSALMKSASKGHLDCVKFLIEQGANIHDKDKREDTALIWSAQEGHLDCVKLLVQQGANMKYKGYQDKTALEWAKKKDRQPVVHYLSRSAKTLQKWFEAAEKGNKKVLTALYTSYISFRDKNSNTALILSARKGHLDCVKYLVAQGADIHTKTKCWRSTALMKSAEKGHLDCVKYLIQQGANIHDEDKNRNTALLLSAQKRQSRLCQISIATRC